MRIEHAGTIEKVEIEMDTKVTSGQEPHQNK